MARFQVTTAALKHLRELRDGYGPDLVIHIYWRGPQADSRRLPDGSTEWTRVSEGEWQVGLNPRAKVEGMHLEVVDDVQFSVMPFPKYTSMDGRTLDYADGKFHVS